MPRIRHEQIATEDALKHLHACEYEGARRAATVESIAGAVGWSRDRAVDLLGRMRDAGLVKWAGESASLTDAGRDYARQVIRAHRLYETYLARQTGEKPGDWHKRADRAEHALSRGDADALANRLGHPRFDPHGDPIPTHGGQMPAPAGISLGKAAVGDSLKIAHVGDEPEALGRRLAEMGFAPGMRVEVVGDRGAMRTICLEGKMLEIEAPAAAMVQAVALTPQELRQPRAGRLSGLSEGREARVLGLSPACVGHERTRLLDLGFVPGSAVRAEIAAPMGGPTAYRVRGAVIALRPRQADLVFIEPPSAS